ncbi:MAG: mechanosensitive ion channel family protein [Acidobacteriota bacterium]
MMFLDLAFLGNTVQEWLTAVLITLLLALVLRSVRNRVSRTLRSLAEVSESRLQASLAEIFSRTKLVVLFVVAVWAGSQALQLPEDVSLIIRHAAIIAILLQTAVWGNSLLGYLIGTYVRMEEIEETARAATATALTFIGRLLLWSLLLLVALQNMGVEVTALLASLGVGGIAVALASQSILGDLFASLSIVFDKPFVVGDFIIVGDLLGTVERIGLKTTRLRSLSGEQLVFSNNDLLASRIRNFKRMQERRVLFSIGVVYETPYAKLTKIPELLNEIISKEEQARFDRAHFKAYGDSSLNFEIVYWVKVPDYNTYMDIQQRINLAIFRRFEEEGISFAYPTRTLYLAQQTPAASTQEEARR